MERIKKGIILKPVSRKQVCRLSRTCVMRTKVFLLDDSVWFFVTLLAGWRQLVDGQSPLLFGSVCHESPITACPPILKLFLQDQRSENRKSAIMELKGMLVKRQNKQMCWDTHTGILRPRLTAASLSTLLTRTEWRTSPSVEWCPGEEWAGMWRRWSSCASFSGGEKWWKTAASPTPPRRLRVFCAVTPLGFIILQFAIAQHCKSYFFKIKIMCIHSVEYTHLKFYFACSCSPYSNFLHDQANK